MYSLLFILTATATTGTAPAAPAILHAGTTAPGAASTPFTGTTAARSATTAAPGEERRDFFRGSFPDAVPVAIAVHVFARERVVEIHGHHVVANIHHGADQAVAR